MNPSFTCFVCGQTFMGNGLLVLGGEICRLCSGSYGAPNSRRQADEEPTISPRQTNAAKLRNAEFISRGGQTIYIERGPILVAYWSDESLNYGSWFEADELPNDPVDLKEGEL
jgi:hypothetical protein